MVVKNGLSLDEVLLSSKTQPKTLHILNFWASWAEPCIQMNELFSALSEVHPSASFWDVDAEQVADLSLHFMVEAVPTFILIRNGQEVSRVNGAKADQLAQSVERQLGQPIDENDLKARLEKLIQSSPVMIFIKGTPTAPRCGFTKQLLSILHEQQVGYEHFDILEDEVVRQGLKEYSNWPTYPQVYIGGELVGGLDIIKELIESGQFQELLPPPS
jgi:Grx4 family monothiol glutaredoxin